MLEWTQGSVAGIVTGLFSVVGAGGVKESFTLAMPDGSVRCALPLGTCCRLSAHLLNQRVTVFGLVGCEGERPRKVLAVRDIRLVHGS